MLPTWCLLRVAMADTIKTFKYSKTGGRGRGILGLTSFEPCRRPGEISDNLSTTRTRNATIDRTEDERLAPSENERTDSGGQGCLLIASHQYKTDPTNPRGFTELSLEKGQLVEFVKEHPDDEDWWEAKNENGDIGYVPSTFVIVKKEHALPWLQWSALQAEEEERKKRVQRVAMKKAAAEGKGFGLPPKSGATALAPKPYVSAYNREQAGGPGQTQNFHCEICDKKFNGPVPYQAHLRSKAHKEEVALLES